MGEVIIIEERRCLRFEGLILLIGAKSELIVRVSEDIGISTYLGACWRVTGVVNDII